MTKIVEPTGDLNMVRLAELLEGEAGLDDGKGMAVLQAVLDIIGRHVVAGHRVRLNNFGSFYSMTRKIASTGLPSQRERGAVIPSQVTFVRFRGTGRLAESMKDGTPVTTLRKSRKGAVRV